MSTVTPDEISMQGSKQRIVAIQPWVAAQLSDLWRQIKANITESVKKKDKQDRVRISQVKPASAHNPT